MGTRYIKVRNPYAIYYIDGTYMVYDLNADDYQMLSNALVDGLKAVIIKDVGVFKLMEVRSVVKQKPEPKAAVSAPPEMNAEEAQWYAEQQAAWEAFGRDEGGIEQ